jgi:hypothetical protein
MADTMRAMHPTVKTAIREALERSETVALPVPQGSIADAARCCVRAQLGVEIPDQYIMHRCLRTIYRQLGHAAPASDEAQAALEEARAIVMSCMDVTGVRADHLYAWIAPKARFIKAIVQMLIGAIAVVRLGAMTWHGKAWWSPHFPAAGDSLTLIGAALAAATVVELAYTLFTDGPDEVLDPLMLGISSFLIIELSSSTTHIGWGTGFGLLLCAITLGLLFTIRRHFIEDAEPVPPFWWRRLRGK